MGHGKGLESTRSIIYRANKTMEMYLYIFLPCLSQVPFALFADDYAKKYQWGVLISPPRHGAYLNLYRVTQSLGLCLWENVRRP